MSRDRKYSDDYLINSVKLAGKVAEELGDFFNQRYYEDLYKWIKDEDLDDYSFERLSLEDVEIGEVIRLGETEIRKGNKEKYDLRDLDLPSRRQITEHIGWSEAMELAGFEPNPSHRSKGKSKSSNRSSSKTLEERVTTFEESVSLETKDLREVNGNFCPECSTLLNKKEGGKYCPNCDVAYE